MIKKQQQDDSKVMYSNRHASYFDTNGVCWYFFKKDGDMSLPSFRFIDQVDGEKVLEYLKIHAKLIADSKSFENDKDEKINNNSLSDIREMFVDDNNNDGAIYIFLIENRFDDIKIESPIIVKLFSDKTSWYLALSSFGLDRLNEVGVHLNNKFIKPIDYTQNTFFGILMNTNNEINITKLPIDDKFSKNLDISLNYGKSFEFHHKRIVDKLETSSNGLFLFHGSAGTGKTTYIKYLAKVFGGKRTFIFIPTTFIDTLTSPSIIPVLLGHPNSVLVLEDAEKAIISRNENLGNESLVSSLLNIGDGILGSMLNLTIILTFNTARENVDNALLRKGRLNYEHAFDKLSVADAQIIIDKLGKKFVVTESMSLAEIYNIDDDNNHKEKERTRVGFGV